MANRIEARSARHVNEVGLGHAPRAHNRFQLRKNRFLARGSENSDADLAIHEVQYRWNTSNAVPQPEIRTPIELHRGYLQTIDKLSGNFVQSSLQHHRRKAPARGKLDQHWLTGS